MLGESLIIAFLGGSLGIGLAFIGVAALSAPLDPLLPFFWMDVRVDRTVLLFTLLLVVLTSFLAGAAPAFKVTGINVNGVLKDEALGVAGLRMGRLSRLLVVGQVALSCGLLTVSGLMVKGTLRSTASDLAFATTDVLGARVTLLEIDYPEESDRDRFYRELVERLNSRPEVAASAVTSALPGIGRELWRIQIDGVEFGDRRELPQSPVAVISPEFFGALDVGLVSGRAFNTGDDASGQPVAIVNQSFADRFCPGESPLGRRFKLFGTTSESEWKTIVGVVPDLGMNRRFTTNAHGFYLPYSQRIRGSMNVIARTNGDPMDLAPAVREVVASLDPNLPIYEVNSLATSISMETVPERTFSVLFICCGSAALVLAMVGLYGVLAFAVRRRTREIGIRMALGAKSERILWLSFKGGFVQLIAGLLGGVCVAALVAPSMQDLFSETSPWDWQTYLTIALTLCCSGILASLVPAARATRVDHMETLRYE
jgi:predicted permease